MISRTAFCSAPAGHDACGELEPNAVDLGQAGGLGLDDLERARAKGGDKALGYGRADAAHAPGGEVLLDALNPVGA